MAPQTVNPSDSTLNILFSRDFPQVLDAAIDRALSRAVKRIEAQMVCPGAAAQSEFVVCSAGRCRERATVCDLQTEREFCLAHFREGKRG
jgi:hypothetical protein